jgi:hypothetical protein
MFSKCMDYDNIDLQYNSDSLLYVNDDILFYAINGICNFNNVSPFIHYYSRYLFSILHFASHNRLISKKSFYYFMTLTLSLMLSCLRKKKKDFTKLLVRLFRLISTSVCTFFSMFHNNRLIKPIQTIHNIYHSKHYFTRMKKYENSFRYLKKRRKVYYDRIS